jgi:ABC-type nitrate/sulfonate/bicarbonate transport system permease component
MTKIKHLPKYNYERWIAVPFVMAILILWEVLASNRIISILFFPAPSMILGAFWVMLLNGKMASNMWATLFRVGIGAVVGIVPGVILGLTMGWSKRVRVFLDPIIAALNPIPKLAIFPLIMIIFGIGETSKIVAIALTTFFPMLINSMVGVRQLNPVYFDVARNYGANKWKSFTHVVLPGSLPMILAGFRIAFSLALVISIAVEMVAATKGLGVLIWFSWETLQTENLYATLLVIGVIGFLINYLMMKLSKILTPWNSRSGED